MLVFLTVLFNHPLELSEFELRTAKSEQNAAAFLRPDFRILLEDRKVTA